MEQSSKAVLLLHLVQIDIKDSPVRGATGHVAH